MTTKWYVSISLIILKICGVPCLNSRQSHSGCDLKIHSGQNFEWVLRRVVQRGLLLSEKEVKVVSSRTIQFTRESMLNSNLTFTNNSKPLVPTELDSFVNKFIRKNHLLVYQETESWENSLIMLVLKNNRQIYYWCILDTFQKLFSRNRDVFESVFICRKKIPSELLVISHTKHTVNELPQNIILDIRIHYV